MKKLKIVIVFLLTFPFLGSFEHILAQNASRVIVLDTRNINDVPGFFKNEVKFDFKSKSVIGLPSGDSEYSGMMTVAPWVDQSGGLNHQLNFNSEGLFYRNGHHLSSLWGAWKKVALTELNGALLSESGGAGLRMKAGNSNHTYLEFYARSADPSTRSGWLGFGALLDNSINIANEMASGNVNIITNSGKVGIDTKNPDAKLTVNGNISAAEIKVEIKNWPDYVFKQGYKLTSLEELANFIIVNNHLPDIPSAEIVERDGLHLGEMSKRLLKKIEELTLYILDQNSVIMSQQERLIILEKEMKELKH